MIDFSLDLDDPEQYEQHRKNMIAEGWWVDRSTGTLSWWDMCLRDTTL